MAKRVPIGSMVVDFGGGSNPDPDEFDDDGDEESNDNPDDFFTKIAGVRSGSDRKQKQEAIERLSVGSVLTLQREPSNPFDSNAVKIITSDGVQLGYINEYRAEMIAGLMDQGHAYEAKVTAVTGGAISNRTGKRRGLGVNLRVRRIAGTKTAKSQEFGEGSFWTLVVIMIVVIVLLALVRVALF